MPEIRAASVAGYFYPGTPKSLKSEVRAFLEEASREGGGRSLSPKALIVPHAGYRYSGSVAASAFQLLRNRHQQITRVVLLGPSHRVGLRGLGASSADGFETPLGVVPLDRQAIEQVLPLPQVTIDDEAHAEEHSLEVQLPFLQTLLGEFSLVPFSVGEADDDEVAEILEALWGGDETLIVISSDLSHHLEYDQAKRRDARTVQAIESLSPQDLDWESACGRVPTRGLLRVAKRRELEVHTLDVRNSGDTTGGRERVVGYGAWAFCEPTGLREETYSEEERAALLEVARRSIEHGVAHDRPIAVTPDDHPARLTEKRACFVTLRRGGELRGCIGSVEAARPLVVDVAERGFAAAFRDPRFLPVTEGEIPGLEIEVSVLGPLRALAVDSEAQLIERLRPGRDGLVLEDAGARGLFLPSVWEQLPEPRSFVCQLKKKAGLPEDHWSSTLACWTFETTKIEGDG